MQRWKLSCKCLMFKLIRRSLIQEIFVETSLSANSRVKCKIIWRALYSHHKQKQNVFYRWTIAMNKSKHYYTFLTQCVQHRLLTSRKIRCKLKWSTISARRTWNVQISCLDIKLLKKPILLKAVIYEWRNANSLLVQLHCIRKEIALRLIDTSYPL